MDSPMVFKVKLFLDENLVKPEDYNRLKIIAPEVDKIVNSICDAERMNASEKTA